MKHLLRNERGYSLLLTFATLIILSVMALSLMTVTTNGIAKNETREDTVQASDLADKGIDFMIKDIQLELENFIKTGNVGKNDFKNKLTSLIESNSISCKSGGIEIPGDSGNTTVCIDVDNINNVYNAKGELVELKKEVPIISTGIVDGKEKVTTSKVIIGTDAVPDQLRYALSTNNGGNLYLHGGVEVQGDIKTDGNLVISKNATWMSGSTPIWQPSVTTKLIPGPGSVTPKVIFSKDNSSVYELAYFGTGKQNNYSAHIEGIELDSSRYNKFSPASTSDQTSISKLFFNSPDISILTKPTIPQDEIEITNTITNKYNALQNKANYTSNLTIDTSNHATKSYKKTDVVFVSDTAKEKVQETYTYYENVCTKTEGWLFPRCVEWKQVEKTGTRWVEANTYKFGSMKIDGGVYECYWNSCTVKSRKDINLKGSYFVYGDLTIENVNLQADAIIYVQGKVKITESTIKGIDDNSTLLIFANDNIDISNMSVDSGKDGATKIKGFFYTKQNMIMYGVGSNINLTGGISARRLILTAVRGDTKNGYLPESDQKKLVNGVASQYSRLKIVYDQDLINTYTSFKRDEEEEYIKSISEPEIINRTK